MSGVLYTQDSRDADSYDQQWASGSAVGNSAVFPADTTACDFVIPSGKCGTLRAVMWLDNPILFVPADTNVVMRVFLNGATVPVIRRNVVTGTSFDITRMDVGFYQNTWIDDLFLRFGQNDIITLALTFNGGIAPTLLRYRIKTKIANESGNPTNTEFTNPVPRRQQR